MRSNSRSSLLALCVVLIFSSCVVHARLPHSAALNNPRLPRVIKHGGQSHPFQTQTFGSSAISKKTDNLAEPIRTHIDIPKDSVKKGILFGSYMFMWYFFTVAYNIANKNVLTALPLPAVIVWTQLLISALLILPMWLLRAPQVSKVHLKDTSVLALLHTMGVYTSGMAMQAGSISFLQIIKASEPVFVAAVSLLLGGRLLPLPVYLTLVPVISGVALASVKDLSFSWQSFAPAVASNTLHPIRMVLFKKYMGNWKAQHLAAPSSAVAVQAPPPPSSSTVFHLVTLLGVLILLPVALLKEGALVVPSLKELASVEAVSALKLSDFLHPNDKFKNFLVNLIVSGVSYFFYNEVRVYLQYVSNHCLIMYVSDGFPDSQSCASSHACSVQHREESGYHIYSGMDVQHANEYSEHRRIINCYCWNFTLLADAAKICSSREIKNNPAATLRGKLECCVFPETCSHAVWLHAAQCTILLLNDSS
jgi:drug/metabolite transporter (DMT)-like permease